MQVSFNDLLRMKKDLKRDNQQEQSLLQIRKYFVKGKEEDEKESEEIEEKYKHKTLKKRDLRKWVEIEREKVG